MEEVTSGKGHEEEIAYYIKGGKQKRDVRDLDMEMLEMKMITMQKKFDKLSC